MTFLFTDVVGSTDLWEHHPAAMRVALAKHDEVVRAALQARGGYIFSTAGDAFSAAFSSPSEAVLAALDGQSALAGVPWPDGIDLRVRMGLHTGTADERQGDYFGPSLNRAARIMGLARGGEVMVSAATAHLTRELDRAGITFVDLGTAELRGIGPEQLYGVAHHDRPADFMSLASRQTGELTARLPSIPTSFLGREVDVLKLASALGAARLITLVGPGGVGKTRLAVEVGWGVAERYPDGVWLVELAPVRERDAVAHALVTGLDVRPIPGQSPTHALIAGLARQRRLVVIDNCEHVLDDVAAVTRQLLDHCPTLTLLATSRAPLGVPGERVWAVAPLPPSGAGAALFVDRAAAAGSTFAADEAAAAIRTLCERLDGMPLAIELAAARARALTPSELLSRLSDRFRLLRSLRAGDERHATLQATVEWSYQLLDPVAQRVFDRLGAFSGPVDLAAVCAVAGDEQLDDLDVIDALIVLVDHSLVIAESDGVTSRYRMFDTMRAYARDRLAEHGELDRLAGRHAVWVAERAAVLNDELVGNNWDAALGAVDTMERLWPDLRAAVTFALASENAALVARLLGSFSVEAMFRERDEVDDWLSLGLNLPGIAADGLAPNLLGVAAQMSWRAGRFEEMTRRVNAALPLLPGIGSDPVESVRLAQTTEMIVTGRVQQARLFLETAHTQLAGAQTFGAGYFDTVIGLVDCYLGQPQRALDRIQAMAPHPNPILRCFQSWVRTAALLDIDPAQAIAPGRETVDMAQQIRASWMVDTVSNYLTAALARAGDAREALETMRSVLVHTAAGGGIQSLGNTIRNGIVLFTRLGQAEPAAVLSGWLLAQPVVIPGTAGMRAHADEAIEILRATLGPDALAAAQARGATMTGAQAVQLFVDELDHTDLGW